MFWDSAFPKLHFIEREYAHDWTNWWVPNRSCVEGMLRASGFSIETRAEDEVYICRASQIPYADWLGRPAVYPFEGNRCSKVRCSGASPTTYRIGTRSSTQ